MYNVIIADDEPAVCEGLANIIPWGDYNFQIVGTALNGKDALNKLYLHRCNLLITDIRMPVLDGLSLIQKVRSSFPQLKIIIISGYSDFSYAKQAIAQGVSGYLLKPIDRDELESYVRQIKAELELETTTERFTKDQNTMARNKFMFDLVQGHLTQSKIDFHAAIYGGLVDYVEYSLALIELKGLYEWVGKSLEQASLIRYGILNIMEEMIELPGYGYLFDYANGYLGVLLYGNAYTVQYASLHSCLEAVRVNIFTFLKIEVNVGFSHPIAKLRELPAARIQATKALEYAGLSSDSKVIRYEEVTDSRHWEKTHLREGKSKLIIDKILQYISLNYHEDLNLKSIANIFYINPAYLGQLFKQIVGEGFNDFLNKTRIEAAKTMVCQSDLMVYEIIDKTGYRNTQYFYKQFKRYEGISFAEYKEKIKRG